MNPHGYGDETVSFVKTLNDSADKCPNHLVRKQLKDIAAEMKATVNTLASDITVANVRKLSELAARGWRKLQVANNTPPIGTGGKLKEPARLAA